MSDTTTTDLSNYTDARQARGLDRILDDIDALAHVAENPGDVWQRERQAEANKAPQYALPPSDAAHEAAHEDEDGERFDGLG